MKPPVSPQAFARLMVRRGSRPIPKKELFSVRIDADVLAWFRALGEGYQSRMNALLRAYMDECEKRAGRRRKD